MSYEIRSILYASDLTPRSPAVFRHAVGLAMKFNAKLHAVTVTLPSSSLPYEEFLSEEKMDEIKLAGHKKAEALLRHRIDVFAEANPELDVKSVLASVRALEGDASRRILADAGAGGFHWRPDCHGPACPSPRWSGAPSTPCSASGGPRSRTSRSPAASPHSLDGRWRRGRAC